MKKIINMEYSLRAILYLIQMQVKESKQSWHYYYTEEYPFLDIPAFKAEVSDYLIQYGSDRLKFFLKECYRLCLLILQESDCLSKIPLANNTGVYCTFEKKETPSFFDAGLFNIDLIKHARPDAKRMEIWHIIDAVKTIACFLADVGFSDIKPNNPTIINHLTNSVSAAAQVVFNETLNHDAVPVSDVSGQKTQAEKQYPPKADDKKPQRIIDVQRLKDYFIAPFKGIGNGNFNFFDMMIEELKMERTPKDFARIAWMIYDGTKMNKNKPTSFEKWYVIFCSCVGCDKKSYKPNDLKPIPERMVMLFGYLK